MIRFQDFEPKQLRPAGFFDRGEIEKTDQALETLNRWVEEYDVDVVNIETVVLPNMHSRREEGTTDPQLFPAGSAAAIGINSSESGIDTSPSDAPKYLNSLRRLAPSWDRRIDPSPGPD